MTIYPMSGGCACGCVRYKLLAAPLSVQHCHCEICRKITGQFSSSGAVVRKKDIEILGAENLTSFRASKSYERQFCSICGGRLFGYEDSEALLMYFAPATLDGGKHPGHLAGSESHIYVNSKAEWETIGDGLPQFEAASPDEIMTDLQRKDTL